MNKDKFIIVSKEYITRHGAKLLDQAVGAFAGFCRGQPTDAAVDEELVSFLSDTFRSSLFHELEAI